MTEFVDWLRGLAAKGGKGVVNNIDARCLGRIADNLETLTREKSALEADRNTLDCALADVCDELGCARDNEAALEAAHTLKSALREALDVMRPFVATDESGVVTLKAKHINAARAFIEKHAPAATSEDK